MLTCFGCFQLVTFFFDDNSLFLSEQNQEEVVNRDQDKCVTIVALKTLQDVTVA